MIDFIIEIFDFFIPRICPGCSKKLTADEKVICNNCFSELMRTDEKLLQEEYERKFSAEGIVAALFAPFVFEKDKALQTLIHELKYSRRFLYGKFLGEIIFNLCDGKIARWKPDFIIPVPLHKLKKTERGYNQSEFLAKGLSKASGIPVKTCVVKRIKYTESQTKLNANERKQNIEGAFRIKKSSIIKNKNILIVDDVITTGATIREIAYNLKLNGCRNIYAISSALAAR